MLLTFLSSRRMSEDGFTVSYFEKGKTYDLAGLAAQRAFNNGWAFNAEPDDLEVEEEAVKAGCSRAWQAFPLDTAEHCLQRWSDCRQAIDPVYAAVNFEAECTLQENKALIDCLRAATLANAATDEPGFAQAVAAYVSILRQALRRHAYEKVTENRIETRPLDQGFTHMRPTNPETLKVMGRWEEHA